MFSVFSQRFGLISQCVFDNLCHTARNILCFLLQGKPENPRTKEPFFPSVELVSLVLSSDPLRSGQGRRHPLQHHRSRRWSTPEWDLQHRPHQRQHVCHPTPRQRGESLLPCKKEMSLSCLFNLVSFTSFSLSPNYPCGNFSLPHLPFILKLILPADQPQVWANSEDSPYCCTAVQSLRALIDAETSNEMMNALAKTHSHFSCHLDWG